MGSINSEWDVIRLIEEELNNRKEDEFKDQLNHLKELAHTIEDVINAGRSDYDVHKATDTLCQDLGVLWRNVFCVDDK